MDLLLEVADPDSPKYGQHYTKQQVVDTFAPAQESIDAVTQWLVEAGIPERSITLSQNKGYLEFETTAGSLESLLKTSYHIFEDQKMSSQHLGADSYSLPVNVAPPCRLCMACCSFQPGQGCHCRSQEQRPFAACV